MSKSPHAPAIQLFPFLAVLICAMGALILLLLATTRRIRHVAVEKAISEQQAAALEAAPRAPLLPPATPLTDLDPAPLYVPPVAIQLARPVPVVDEAAAVRLRAEWGSIVQELARDYSEEVRQLAAIRAEALAKEAELKTAEEAQTAQIKRIDAQKLRAQRLRDEAAADVARLDQEQAQIDGTIRGVRKAAQVKAEDLANQPVPYTLLPYDGTLGTTRRPIIIECDERSIVFRCEGIELTSLQLSGFPSEYNPLLAGTRALHEYWVVRDRETATLRTPPPPYVLLVVRPKGTVAFYVARKLLEKFEHPFGYELVEEGRELTWPASDEQATRVCRESIERVLAEREKVMARLPGGRSALPGELRYDGQEGQFATEEVERLRNLDASVVVGGQRWRRDPKTPGSSEPTPFQSAGRGYGSGSASGPGSGGSPRSGSPGSGSPGRGEGPAGAPGGRGNGRGPGSETGELASTAPPSGLSSPFGEGPNAQGFEAGGGDQFASNDPRATGAEVSGGGSPGDPSVPAGQRPSPNDHRPLPNTRVFQGSGGPRLGSPSGGPGQPGGGAPSGGGSSPPSAGDLHPWHDLESPPNETVLPQGTGPINGRYLAQHGGAHPGGPRSTTTGGEPAAGGIGTGPGTGPGTAGVPSDGTTSPGGGEPSGASGGSASGSLSGSPGFSGTPGPAGSSGTSGTSGPTGAASGNAGQPGSGNGGPATGGAPGGASGGTPGPAGMRGPPGSGSAVGTAPSGEQGEAAPEGMPVPRNLRAIGQGDPNAKGGKPADRRWGTPDHDGSIALERTVTIEIKERGVFLEDEPEISLRDGTAYRELKDALAFTLDGYVGKWGRPPASFYWLPTVNFRIHPGGNQYYQALKALTDDWGLRSKVEHVLE